MCLEVYGGGENCVVISGVCMSLWCGVWPSGCMYVSVLCGSVDVWWHVLWCWWLPVECAKCIGVSGVCVLCFWVSCL